MLLPFRGGLFQLITCRKVFAKQSKARGRQQECTETGKCKWKRPRRKIQKGRWRKVCRWQRSQLGTGGMPSWLVHHNFAFIVRVCVGWDDCSLLPSSPSGFIFGLEGWSRCLVGNSVSPCMTFILFGAGRIGSTSLSPCLPDCVFGIVVSQRSSSRPTQPTIDLSIPCSIMLNLRKCDCVSAIRTAVASNNFSRNHRNTCLAETCLCVCWRHLTTSVVCSKHWQSYWES